MDHHAWLFKMWPLGVKLGPLSLFFVCLETGYVAQAGLDQTGLKLPDIHLPLD